MLRRAHGLRWNALREKARSTRKGAVASGLAISAEKAAERQLTSALEAEARAAARDEGLKARAGRRAERLLKVKPTSKSYNGGEVGVGQW